MNKKQLAYLIGAPLLAVILVSIRVYYSLAIWTYDGPDKSFDILPGDNFSKINSRLINEQLISSARLFHRLSQYHGVINKFKTGRYIIKTHSNMLNIYNTFINEKSMVFLFTIPEGKNMYEIGHMLEDQHITSYKDFIAVVKDKEFLKSEGIEADTAEGYLYPESYDFLPNLPAKMIVKLMIKQYHKKIAAVHFENSKLTPFEILTLASVVEKETGDKKERAMVAGVFHNRLKIKMRLQSDPTTIYGFFENYKGNITKKDLLTPSEYNTYTLPALPKGPICNPGIASIEAVLNPADHKFLYFVSQNNGTHIFSANYEDHLKAVATWQLNAKNREGRSWRDHQDSN
jgi:UPF0755 protein